MEPMNRPLTNIILLSVVLSFFAFALSAQSYLDRKGIVRKQLMILIQQKYGSEFVYVGYSMLDSLIAYSLRENDRRRDPYNTLKGCILFSTHKETSKAEPDTFIVGMVRDGAIIWDNAPGSHANLGGDLYYVMDLNSDHEVDLLVFETDNYLLRIGKGPLLDYLYILSWDGSRGRFINSFLPSGKSAIIGWLFEPVKSKRKGIKDIIGVIPNLDAEWDDYRTKTFPRITYTWNGKHYGLWKDARQTEAARIRPFWWREVKDE